MSDPRFVITVRNPSRYRGVRKAAEALHQSMQNSVHYGHGGATFQGFYRGHWCFRCGCSDELFIPPVEA